VTDFCKNLEWLRSRSGLGKAAFADELKIDRTSLSRLFSGKRPPTPSQLDKLAKYGGFDAEDLLLPYNEFMERNKKISSNLVLLAFRTIRANLSRQKTIFDAYCGQYTVYYRGKKRVKGERRVVSSLLDIHRRTQDTIQFRFINPYLLPTGEWAAYEYSGFVFPVGETLYLLGEQKSQEYEILSMLIQMSPAPKVSILRGLMTGVGVENVGGVDRGHIAARSIVLSRRRRPLGDWRAGLTTELGFLPESKMPEVIQRELSDDKIDV
jgi:transcriptional regulator with XRE-family HTH domain